MGELASKTSQISELWLHMRDLASLVKVGQDQSREPAVSFGLHTHVHKHALAPLHTHTHTNKMIFKKI